MSERWYQSVLAAVVLIGVAAPGGAQPTSVLLGCLDANGNLYNVRPLGSVTEKCPGTDLQVRLGSGTIESVSPGPGLVGGGLSGDVTLGLDPKVALPPDCPPGQVPLSDEQGGWVCTPPSLIGARNPAGKLWVLPRVDFCVLPPAESGGRPTVRFCRANTSIVVLNPGAVAARVSCLYFDRRGSLLVLSHPRSFVLGEGGQGICSSPTSDEVPGAEVGWGLVVSDQDVLPTAAYYSGGNNDQGFQVEAYPVDCSHPDGHEFVCRFASED